MWSLVAGSALVCRGTHLRTLTQLRNWPLQMEKYEKWMARSWENYGELHWRHHICSILFHPSTIIYHSDPFGPFTSSPQHHRHHHHHPLSNSDKRQITSKLYFNTAPWKTRDWTWLQKHQHCLLAYLDSVLTCLPFHESPCANNLRQMISLLVQWEEMAGEQAHGARQLDKNMSQEKFIAICLLPTGFQRRWRRCRRVADWNDRWAVLRPAVLLQTFSSVEFNQPPPPIQTENVQ